MDTMTHRLHLCVPQASDEAEVWEYRQTFLDSGDNLAGTAALATATSFVSWLRQVRADINPATVRPGYVPAQLYLAKRIKDDTLIGMVQVRLNLNDYLRAVGGHVGYSVHPSHRRQGYGTEILALALEKCRELHISPVLLTCDRDNAASARVIQANGGVFENEVDDGGTTKRRYWIRLSR